VSILGLTWPWKTKRGRTVKSYDKIGRLRVLCIAGGSPVTGEIKVRQRRQYGLDGPISRWTRCPECNHLIRVIGRLKSKMRLTVHNADKKP
jgi:hypothetical protein